MNTETNILLGLGIVGLAIVGTGIVVALVSDEQVPPPDDVPPPQPPEDAPGDAPPPAPPADLPDAFPVGDPLPNPGPLPPLPRPRPPLQGPGLGLGTQGTSRLVGVLSQQAAGGTWCDVPVVPRGVKSEAGEIRDVTGNPALVWGWQGPGGKALFKQPVAKFGSKFILHLVHATVSPEGWQGGASQISSADYLAQSVHGVAADGIIPFGMQPVLAKFAARSRVGYPVVSGGAKPRERLAAILESWRGVGFTALVPILDVGGGVENLRTLIDECGRLGLDYMLTSLQTIQQFGLGCSIREG